MPRNPERRPAEFWLILGIVACAYAVAAFVLVGGEHEHASSSAAVGAE